MVHEHTWSALIVAMRCTRHDEDAGCTDKAVLACECGAATCVEHREEALNETPDEDKF